MSAASGLPEVWRPACTRLGVANNRAWRSPVSSPGLRTCCCATSRPRHTGGDQVVIRPARDLKDGERVQTSQTPAANSKMEIHCAFESGPSKRFGC